MVNNIDIKNRRNFLKSAMKSGFCLNLMKSSTLATAMLMGRKAYAMGDIKRVVTVFIPGGAPFDRSDRSQYIPQNNRSELPVVSRPLQEFRDRTVFFRGGTVVNFNGEEARGHRETEKALGGFGRANTYDVELERTLGARSLFPAIYLGVRTAGQGFVAHLRDNSRNHSFQDNPSVTFNRLFSGNNVSSLDVQRGQSAIDIQRREIRALRNLLGQEERVRLNEQLTALRTVERRLQDSQGSLCSNPEFNNSNFRYNRNNENFTRECDLQSDLAALALSCNMTNVVAMSFGTAQCRFTVRTPDYNGAYHASIHGPGRRDNFVASRTYLTERFAYLLRQLDSARDESGASLLDSTLVIQVSDMGFGSSHSGNNAPVTLISGSSRLRGGRVLNATRQQDVLDTATRLLGLSIPNLGTGSIDAAIS